MNDQISWYVQLEVRADRVDEFRLLTDEMVASAQSEAGTLVYERYLGDDGKTVHVYERYSDSMAAQDHLERFASAYGERFSNLIERKRFTVFGTPSDSLRSILSGFGATDYLETLAGFSKC